MSAQSWEEQRGDPQAGGLVLSSSSTSLQTLSKVSSRQIELADVMGISVSLEMGVVDR